MAEDAASHLHASPQSVSSVQSEPDSDADGPDQGHLMPSLACSVWSRVETREKKKKNTLGCFGLMMETSGLLSMTARRRGGTITR